MTRAEILHALSEILKDIFDDETLIIDENTTRSNVDGWDSMEQISIIAAIERRFAVKFDMADVLHLTDVKDIISLVYKEVNNA